MNDTERQQYAKLIELDDVGEFAMAGEMLENSLLMLSRFLQKHYGQKTIILIDEYDVPLDKAYQSGYYDNENLTASFPMIDCNFFLVLSKVLPSALFKLSEITGNFPILQQDVVYCYQGSKRRLIRFFRKEV